MGAAGLIKRGYLLAIEKDQTTRTVASLGIYAQPVGTAQGHVADFVPLDFVTFLLYRVIGTVDGDAHALGARQEFCQAHHNRPRSG